MRYLYGKLHFKDDSVDGEIIGYASVFNVIDSFGDIVDKGAFSLSVQQANQYGTFPKFLWQHNVDFPIGVWTELIEDNYGLLVKGRLLLNIPKAQEVYHLLKNNVIDGLSIGYKIIKKSCINNKTHINLVDLKEISIVTFPACPKATIQNVKSDNESYKCITILNKLTRKFRTF